MAAAFASMPSPLCTAPAAEAVTPCGAPRAGLVESARNAERARTTIGGAGGGGMFSTGAIVLLLPLSTVVSPFTEGPRPWNSQRGPRTLQPRGDDQQPAADGGERDHADPFESRPVVGRHVPHQ